MSLAEIVTVVSLLAQLVAMGLTVLLSVLLGALAITAIVCMIYDRRDS